MTRPDLSSFREILGTKQAELAKARGWECIAIEKSADELEEADSKSARDLAIAGLNRETMVRRSVPSALIRIQDGSFGTCGHCGDEISRRRLEALPWTPLCIRCQEAADLGEEVVLDGIAPTFPDAA